jgi:transposase-like protein
MRGSSAFEIIKNTVDYKDLREVCADLKAIYTAPTAEAGMLNLEAFSDKWDEKYEYISRSWLENWEQLSTFWNYPAEIRRLIYTTNPIESFKSCLSKSVSALYTIPFSVSFTIN